MANINTPSISTAFKQALISCFHPKVWLAFCIPFLTFIVSSILLGTFFGGLINDLITFLFSKISWVESINLWFDNTLGFGVTSFFIWLATFLTVLALGGITAVVISALIVDDMLIKHIYKKKFAHLDIKGVSLKQDIKNTLYYAGIFVVTIFIGLPLWFIPPIAIAWQIYWTRFFFSRTLPFDALCDYANDSEIKQILSSEKPANEKIGLFCALLNYIPTAALFVPIFAILWFGYYNFAVLDQRRQNTIS
ncbi:EI24 domain-containing protein [Thorsellia anophelis]|uniref:Etoposide-induced protein 2.4 (EI24) n=1 Tax=Thorsellia anophelis DSM 18579 TaxID=1123402 RepID=A0A1H9Y2P8_9GAMM|nr:EI24 domain-containing protein [Thorsellia anophelis]SES63061.1 Etoposide-induced protein 2.4 (EI24) [Thorsellia anophelis DSM 18579]